MIEPRGFSNAKILRVQRVCYLCGHPFSDIPKATPFRRRMIRDQKPTLDHVTPRCAGASLLHNKLYAHLACNALKADRMPRACELLFLSIVNDICAARAA